MWRVLKTQHTQPGKGGAYLQVELKNIKDGTKINERFRSSESVEKAVLEEKRSMGLDCLGKGTKYISKKAP